MNKTLQLLCINRLLLLFDSFQSCYKDKIRFYAGIYFLYRVSAFFDYMRSETLPPVFLAMVILRIHSILQPYKSWKHNIIDALIFLNIAIINRITEMIKMALITEGNILLLKSIQLASIYVPMVSSLLVLSLKIGRKLCFLWKSCKNVNKPPDVLSPCASRDTETEPEVAFPLAELQASLLIQDKEFQYTLQN